MAHRQPYLGIGFALAVLIGAAAGWLAVAVSLPSLLAGHPRTAANVAGELGIAIAILYAALMVAMVVHELGHYLTARLVKVQVTGVHLGAPPALVRFDRGQARIELGPVPHGRVGWTGRAPAGRAAIITFAGSLADLTAAAVAMILPTHSSVRFSFAIILASTGVANLMPFRSKNGRLTDGARLLRAPAQNRSMRNVQRLLEDPDWRSRPEAADVLLRGCQLEVPAAVGRWHVVIHLLKQAGRTRAMLRLHRDLPQVLPASARRELVLAVHHSEWLVATVPDLSQADINLASRRMAWVIKHSSGNDGIAARHTLAIVRLRQGRPADAERLCADALAASLEPGPRALVLATVAMARHAAGRSGHEALAEALALDPSSDLVAEAATRLDRPGRKDRGSRRPRRREPRSASS